MVTKAKILLLVNICILSCFSFSSMQNQSNTMDWGFYAHKLLNRHAVYTLPQELIGFYKANISYISEHAIDPDKRRYAVKEEGIRHYLDLDHWTLGNPNHRVPRDYSKAILGKADFFYIKDRDTILLFNRNLSNDSLIFSDAILNAFTIYHKGIDLDSFLPLFRKQFMPLKEPDYWMVNANELSHWIGQANQEDKILIIDSFSKHGILPYNLEFFYHKLIKAFKAKDRNSILRLSADIGHYIGDAHVPLHTTKNYNGQLTNQDGIHAFWESRLPELFAEKEFDLIVGPASYISDIQNYFWEIILESHRGVEKVLQVEKELSKIIPQDQQYCFDERLSQITKIQCVDYSKKYHQGLDFQVEDQFRACIISIGSVWMSAWVEAGQPIMEPNKMEVNIDFVQDTINPNSKKLLDVRPHE